MIQSQLCLVSISCSLMLSPFHSHSHRTAAGALAFSFSLLQILYHPTWLISLQDQGEASKPPWRLAFPLTLALGCVSLSAIQAVGSPPCSCPSTQSPPCLLGMMRPESHSSGPPAFSVQVIIEGGQKEKLLLPHSSKQGCAPLARAEAGGRPWEGLDSLWTAHSHLAGAASGDSRRGPGRYCGFG